MSGRWRKSRHIYNDVKLGNRKLEDLNPEEKRLYDEEEQIQNSQSIKSSRAPRSIQEKSNRRLPSKDKKKNPNSENFSQDYRDDGYLNCEVDVLTKDQLRDAFIHFRKNNEKLKEDLERYKSSSTLNVINTEDKTKKNITKQEEILQSFINQHGSKCRKVIFDWKNQRFEFSD